MMRITHLLHSSRLLLAPRHPAPVLSRLFSSKQPDWMDQADREATSATNARAAEMGTANDQMMGKLKHEMDGEKISHAIKLEDKLKQYILKCEQARADAVDKQGRMVYSAIRKKAMMTRNELITQREASGMATDAAGIVEASFPIPPQI